MSYLDFFTFLTGLARFVKIDFGGGLFATDLLLTLFFLFSLGRVRKRLVHGLIGFLLFMGALWMLNAIVTDLYRGTAFDDWSRGWAKIFFFLVDFCGLSLLTNSRIERFYLFFIGGACGLLLQAVFFPNEFQVGESAWKFGYGPAFSLIAAVLGATALPRRLFGATAEFVPLVIVGVVNLAFDARSEFAIAMAAVTFGIFKRAVHRRPQLQARITPAFFVVLVGGGIMLSQGLLAVYSSAAENGWLGLDAKDKYEAQSSGDLNLVIVGRAESLAAIRAIADAPIIGHGSWARDITYVSFLVDMLANKGIAVAGDPYLSDLIPSHSHLLGAWVEAGIMGGSFWIVVLVIAMVAIYQNLKRENVPGSFVAFILFALIWDVLFSPFAAEQRFLMPAKICVALWVVDRSQRIVGLTWQKA